MNSDRQRVFVCAAYFALCACQTAQDQVCDATSTRTTDEACLGGLSCAPGTVLRDGECAVELALAECGPGEIVDDDGETCVPTEGRCRAPAELDPTTGLCVTPGASGCGNGTEERDGLCVPTCDGEFEVPIAPGFPGFPACELRLRIQIVHASADPALAVLDVYSGGELLEDENGVVVGDDLTFQSATPFVKFGCRRDAPLEIRLGDSSATSPPLFFASDCRSVNLSGRGERRLVVILGVQDPSGFAGEDEIALNVVVLRGLLEESSSADGVRFAFVNASTDAPPLDLNLVGNDGAAATPLFSALPYAAFRDPLRFLIYTNPVSAGPPLLSRGTQMLSLTTADEQSSRLLLSLQTSSEPTFPASNGFPPGLFGVLVVTGFVEPTMNVGGSGRSGIPLGVLAVLPDGQTAVLDSN